MQHSQTELPLLAKLCNFSNLAKGKMGHKQPFLSPCSTHYKPAISSPKI